MRRAAYVGASVAASTAVVLRAFHERPNFYSATVYLGQSTACRMILLNMLLLTLGSSIYGLQRLLYGPLRAIEIEQLWDKTWYAITETALAMTTFRDEVGGYFFLMFMTLLAGKVWGWIGEGRVETLEQQPPANPKTFHARLITSLLLSEVFDLLMLRYCVRTVLDQTPPRAGMMVMFIFEFAILAINSTSTLARYALALKERYVIHVQTKAKIEERKEEIRIQREEERRQEIENAPEGHTVAPPRPVLDEDIDENEIDVPGWQEKGKFTLFLDLLTDFLKLVFYMGFFLILIIFAGIPIHMFRDLYFTTRSFLKRINDYLKYRNATRDMNTRYPDATVEELERDGTCIICREDMHPWQETHGPDGVPARTSRSPPDERRRPKKLPCGHILHVGCLRSWLERQQVCPTCRRSVLTPNIAVRTSTGEPLVEGRAHQENQPPGEQRGNENPNDQRHQPRGDANGPFNGVAGIRARTINFGAFRLTFAAGNARQVHNALNNFRNRNQVDQANQGNPGNVMEGSNAVPRVQLEPTQVAQPDSNASFQDQLSSLERHIMAEIQRLNVGREQLSAVRALEGELSRLRATQANALPAPASQIPFQPFGSGQRIQGLNIPPNMIAAGMGGPGVGQQQVFSAQPHEAPLGPGNPELPSGLSLPEGWSMLPLRRITPEASGHVPNGQNPNFVVPQASLPPGARSASVPPNLFSQAVLAQASRSANSRTPQPTPTTQAAVNSVPTSGLAQATDNSAPSTTANTNSTTIETDNARQEGTENDDEPELVTGLPNWSTTGPGAAQQQATASETSHGEGSSNADGSGTSSMNGHAREDKGKGRAATVEEAPDPDA